MLRVLATLLLFAAFCLGVALSYFNWNPVTFNYLTGQVETHLVFLLLGAFLTGILLAVLLTAGRMLALRYELSRLRKQLRDNEAELKNLRSLPLKEAG